ncbi:carbohydrate ABC transporter permease [Natronococcus sp. A-GB7]|jgi:glucose/mannose transport system permease protein|uniref:carbohydrate ABC transporter permease n=1 Tax=Natronococcus sp. A-GB7 TaxID=3037649 RepID=UPI00241DFF3B|nr:carbohydrate ABC transporter permease [Natronococcus sp. A-GB7]MDG5818219.1 carbohydrate ABC transporter permease [Natronococcus sp. A-GB7]
MTAAERTESTSSEGRIATTLETIDSQRAALYAVLLGLIAFYLSPLWGGLTTAFKTQTGFVQTTPLAPPTPEWFTLEPWELAFATMQGGLVNSLLFVVPATILSALFGSLAAYGLTKLSWRGQIGILVLFLAGVFLPYQSVLVPLRQFWSAVDLAGLLAFAPFLANRADLIELTVTHTAYGIPICTILFRSYYKTLDDEMIEAAKIDGASAFGIYKRIVLPLSMPMFAVTLIYQFTQVWNDLLFALVLVTSRSNYVVTQSLNELQGSMAQEYNIQMAGAFIAALPTILIYVVFGRQFAKGITGAS